MQTGLWRLGVNNVNDQNNAVPAVKEGFAFTL